MSHLENSHKHILRRQMLNRRDQLPESQTASVSGSLWHFLSPVLMSAQKKRKTPLTVMAYMSFRGEFPTQDFCQRVLDRGIELILPFTDPNFVIHPCRVHHLDDLKASPLGIREPDPSVSPEVSVQEPDFILLPGVVFDRCGNRIGFGRGCYDRFLEQRTRPVTLIGAAYDFQVVSGILPADPGDIPADYIVTESGLISCTEYRMSTPETYLTE